MSRKAEIGFFAILTLGGSLYFLAATQYPVGEMTSPGPGLMPRILGVVLIGLSVYLFVRALLASKPGERKQPEEADCRPENNTPLWVILVMVLYTATLNFFGFSLATFPVIFTMGKIMGLEGWKTPLLLTVCVVAGAMLVFGFMLDVPLPKGTIWEG
jgi:putative tricarboxylic transport membrane protein